MDAMTITVGLVAPRKSQALEIAGPADAFAQAGQIRGARIAYQVVLLGTEPGPITAASGISLPACKG